MSLPQRPGCPVKGRNVSLCLESICLQSLAFGLAEEPAGSAVRAAPRVTCSGLSAIPPPEVATDRAVLRFIFAACETGPLHSAKSMFSNLRSGIKQVFGYSPASWGAAA